ncbi:MAG: ribosome-associated protein [Parasphingorhabdus sp.]|jgi:ribosome-associated protein
MSKLNTPKLSPEQTRDEILASLEDNKGQSIECLDVTGLTSIADYMVVVSGTSSRHVKALASHVASDLRDLGVHVKGIEGEQEGEWILLDFGDSLVHVMQHTTREFYDLESLWQSGFRQAEELRSKENVES